MESNQCNAVLDQARAALHARPPQTSDQNDGLSPNAALAAAAALLAACGGGGGDARESAAGITVKPMGTMKKTLDTSSATPVDA